MRPDSWISVSILASGVGPVARLAAALDVWLAPQRGQGKAVARSEEVDGQRLPPRNVRRLFRVSPIVREGTLIPGRARELPNRNCRGERPAGRAQLLAKRGSTGQMQTPAELVPVRNGPQCGVKAP